MSGAVRAVMDALNAMIECEETRSTQRRYLTSFALAVVVMVLIACALFVVFVSDKLLGASGGAAHWLVALLRWPEGAIFLGVAVGLVARFAPVEHRGKRWASVGAALIVVAWLVESAVYAWFLQNVPNYKSASGNLLLVVVIATYFYVSSIVFLVGAQLDEFLRRGGEGKREEDNGRVRARPSRFLDLYTASTAVWKGDGSSRSERKSRPQRRPLRLRTYVPLWLLRAQSA